MKKLNKLNVKKVLVIGSLVIILIGIYVITLDITNSHNVVYALSDTIKHAAEFNISELKEIIVEGAKFR